MLPANGELKSVPGFAETSFFGFGLYLCVRICVRLCDARVLISAQKNLAFSARAEHISDAAWTWSTDALR